MLISSTHAYLNWNRVILPQEGDLIKRCPHVITRAETISEGFYLVAKVKDDGDIVVLGISNLCLIETIPEYFLFIQSIEKIEVK